MTDFIKWVVSLACMLAGFLFGGLDGLLKALLVFMVLDCLTGMIYSGFKGGGLSSQVGYFGFLKKFLILCIIIVANAIDVWILGIESSACRNTVIGFYLANEGISILENIGNMGIPLPEQLKKILKQLKEENQNKR